MSDTPAGTPPVEAFAMRRYWQALAVIAIFALWPMLVVYVASVVADLNHCTIVDGGPTPCAVLGADVGGALYGMASMVQVSIVALPIGILLGFLWVGVLIINAMAWRRRRAGIADATRIEVNYTYYALALAVIAALGYATLAGWLPAPVLALVMFTGVFWVFSFVFALLGTLRSKLKAK